MAKKSKTQIRVEYAALRLVFGVLGLMPRRLAVLCAVSLFRLAFYVLSGPRRTGMRNLELAFPEKSEAERIEILKGTFQNLGRVLGEMSHFMRTTPDKIARIVDFKLDEVTAELFRRHKEEGRGVLITTGHFGNWEMLVFAFAALHEPMSYLARPLDNPMIEDLTQRIRTRFGNRPINKTNSAMLAIKILRDGGILGILADVNSVRREGVFVPFFGVPACTTAGAAMLSLRAESYIFPIFCIWDKGIKRYRIIHGPILEPIQTGDRKQDIIETTALYTAEIEKIIRQYPDQWMWIHKRWKTRPQGEKDLYGQNK